MMVNPGICRRFIFVGLEFHDGFRGDKIDPEDSQPMRVDLGPDLVVFFLDNPSG